MNFCHQCDELISEYIEDELDYKRKLFIEKHLINCQPRSSTVKNISALRKKLKSLPVVAVSADFDTILRDRIRLERKKERQKKQNLFFSWKLRIPAYGISLALIVFIVTMVFSKISNKNTYFPQAATNAEWKNGRINQQNTLPSNNVIFYSPDRAFAIDVIPQHPGKYLEEHRDNAKSTVDSSALVAYKGKTDNLSEKLFQTSY